ncbi:MAG: hypothetical protein PHV33_07525 [Elusimicrobiales bacterium]|nr:hypothetical protein [Elusimicrobiales bacterium]
MKSRQGQVLLYVLVSVGLLLTIGTHLLSWSLQTKAMRTRVVQRETKLGQVEAARGKMWGCLRDEGYPGTSCTATSAQRACEPSGFTVSYSGTPPECKVKITVN